MFECPNCKKLYISPLSLVELCTNCLDAERAEHAKEVADLHKWHTVHLLTIDKLEKQVADLRQRISELEGQLQDKKGSNTK
jgi:uncharacterized small protein (DUF1192 family)